MDVSMLGSRGIGPGPYPDVAKIPTPPLQQVGLFVIFFFPSLSIVAVSLRFYTRITMRTLGLGTFIIFPIDGALLIVCP